ncbi:MAG: hypothetical protein WAN35_15885 [Terracidiphilus sp.]
MTTSTWNRNSQSVLACYREIKNKLMRQSSDEPFDLKLSRVAFLLIAAAVLACLSLTANPQSAPMAGDSSSILENEPSAKMDLAYVRPTQRTMVSNYLFDAYGPYPIVGAGLVAAFHQESNAPPEWKQGAAGYGKRFGSDFAIATVRTTTRYSLSEAFKEDALYYRCECEGFLPRLSHAALSTLTARRGEDGHRVFSIPALVAPYAGSMTVVYGWYPDRFGAKDAFRIGNYSLLLYMAGNISLEFFYSGPHSLLHRMHLNDSHGSPVEGPNK